MKDYMYDDNMHSLNYIYLYQIIHGNILAFGFQLQILYLLVVVVEVDTCMKEK
jgi:hypothetical protein